MSFLISNWIKFHNFEFISLFLHHCRFSHSFLFISWFVIHFDYLRFSLYFFFWMSGHSKMRWLGLRPQHGPHNGQCIACVADDIGHIDNIGYFGIVGNIGDNIGIYWSYWWYFWSEGLENGGKIALFDEKWKLSKLKNLEIIILLMLIF